MTVWYCLWNSLQDFWSVSISKSKSYHFYSCFLSSTFKLVRNMKFSLPLPITVPVIIAGNDMVKSAHPSLPHTSQTTVLKGKRRNVSHRAGSRSLPLCQRNMFLSAGLVCSDLLCCFLSYVTDSPTQNCLSFPNHWLPLFCIMSLWKKERQTFLKRKPSSLKQVEVPKCPHCWFCYPKGLSTEVKPPST